MNASRPIQTISQHCCAWTRCDIIYCRHHFFCGISMIGVFVVGSTRPNTLTKYATMQSHTCSFVSRLNLFL